MPGKHLACSINLVAAGLSGTPRFHASTEVELSGGESGRITSLLASRKGSEPAMTTRMPKPFCARIAAFVLMFEV